MLAKLYLVWSIHHGDLSQLKPFGEGLRSELMLHLYSLGNASNWPTLALKKSGSHLPG